jgi:hypothetical protein
MRTRSPMAGVLPVVSVGSVMGGLRGAGDAVGTDGGELIADLAHGYASSPSGQ